MSKRSKRRRRVVIRHPLHDSAELAELQRMPLAEKVTHRRTVRHIVAVGVSVGIMVLAAKMETYGDDVEIHGIPACVWGAFWWMMHGVGAVPVATNLEDLWTIFLPELGS